MGLSVERAHGFVSSDRRAVLTRTRAEQFGEATRDHHPADRNDAAAENTAEQFLAGGEDGIQS